MYSNPFDRVKQSLFRRSVYYRDFWALKDITLDVNPATSLGIIGRNGSGKSTLLQIICGTVQPTCGTVATEGKIAALLELGSGFNPEFTGIENIYLNAALFGLTRRQTEQRLDSILSFADIGEHVHQPTKTYSSGMVVRLAFSVLAHIDAEVLVVDEALAVGDMVFTQRCMRYIHKFREHGTLLYVSHDPSSITALTEKCLWLHEGKVRFIGDTLSAITEYTSYSQVLLGFRQSSSVSSQDSQQSSSHNTHDSDMPMELPSSDKITPMNAQADTAGITSIRHDQGFCDGKALITGVRLSSLEGQQPSSVLNGGLPVTLAILWQANAELVSPIAGFQIKDKNGQVIFGESTYFKTNLDAERTSVGQTWKALFSFEWPYLKEGDYSIDIAVSSGTQQKHINHHWIDDAVLVHVSNPDVLVHGIFSPTYRSITLAPDGLD